MRDEELKPVLWEKQFEAISHFGKLEGGKGETVKKKIEARWMDISPRLQVREPNSPHYF